MSSAASQSRKPLSAVLGALTLGTLSFVATLALVPSPPAPYCGPTGVLLRPSSGPAACAHADVAPPGIDITEPVPTAELKDRVGAGPSALEAAEDLGVASAPASTATIPDVSCDGDGTSGYRTQAMYVVEAGATNRYASMKSTIQKWAAGVDDVVNRSAALTGGVRHVRYVTEPGGGGCVASVLNVTVPAGAMADFNATINAVRALGYDSPARKYLMWTDTSGKGICGIALMYPNDGATQSNPNNGSHSQYARIDSPCWGLGNGTNEHSVEAHELVHTFGAVMSTAPHGTRAGHCWDEYDTMCYADGGGLAIQQICPLTNEYLLDCNTDDYFSTFPDPGSWLDNHWNAADSRFLIGGGDGSGGGSDGTPTVLGAAIGVNNPAVPGLATQVSVTPALPTGRRLASVAWTSKKTDCVFSDPTGLQSDVTCSAASTTSTTVTATLTDSTGATKIVSSPLTFAINTARPVTVGLSVAAQDAADVDSASLCNGAASPVVATLTDTATDQPIKGLAAAFTKQATGATTPSSAGSATSTADGTATVSQTTKVATTFGAKTAATKVYAAAGPATLPTSVGTCSPSLTADATGLEVWYGDPVTVSGTLTRDVDGRDIPVAGVTLPVTVTTTTTSATGATTTKVSSLGSARTLSDGSYSIAVKPTTTGALKVALPGSLSYTATSEELGQVVVSTPITLISGEVDKTEVGYGQTVTVTGRLTKEVDSTIGVAGATVAVKVETVPGKAPTQVATGKTSSDGSFSIPAVLKVSGKLQVVYAGAPGLPAVTADVDDVTAAAWDVAISNPTASPTSVAPAKPATITGTVTRTYAGVTEPAKALRLTITAQPTGDTATSLSAVTTATGAFTLKVTPKVTTTYTVKVSGVAGHDNATATPVTVTVTG
jgi:hypothetical protein